MEQIIIQYCGTIETLVMHGSFLVMTTVFCYHMVYRAMRKEKRESEELGRKLGRLGGDK